MFKGGVTFHSVLNIVLNVLIQSISRNVQDVRHQQLPFSYLTLGRMRPIESVFLVRVFKFKNPN